MCIIQAIHEAVAIEVRRTRDAYVLDRGHVRDENRRQLNHSASHMQHSPSRPTIDRISGHQVMIFLVAVPGPAHPHVVIQADVLNRSRIATVVVCALTTNLKRANEPGNVLLDVSEANLPEQSVLVVSQVCVVEETRLGEFVGTLDEPRIQQILAGMRFQQRSFFER